LSCSLEIFRPHGRKNKSPGRATPVCRPSQRDVRQNVCYYFCSPAEKINNRRLLVGTSTRHYPALPRHCPALPGITWNLLVSVLLASRRLGFWLHLSLQATGADPDRNLATRPTEKFPIELRQRLRSGNLSGGRTWLRRNGA